MGEIKSAERDVAHAKKQLSLRLNVIADAIMALYPNGMGVSLRADVYCVSEGRVKKVNTDNINPPGVNARRHISYTVWL
ncbi:GTP cyclohydrolase [Acrasis kona]|uniref:GTP cyclohydrolase n=1 Tax=Acrasis kona TaxID=1008807 RepID=A0AAW2ZGY4_9EUKA